MKKISLLVLLSFISNVALADCDWSTGVTKLPDGSFKYSAECHIKVGETVRDLDIAKNQIVDYKKAIELKDLALQKSDERVNLWMDTSYKLQDRMAAIDSIQSKNNWLHFGLGVVFTGLAVWGAGQLRR